MNSANHGKRRFLTIATSFIAGAGLVGLSIPFIKSWNPSAQTRAEGAPVKVDVSKIDPGFMVTVKWRSKPVWVLRRTEEQVKGLSNTNHITRLRDPDSIIEHQPEYARNSLRSIRDEILVVVGICTHLGCVPKYQPYGVQDDYHAMYFCPCHGSKFDLAGRVYKSVPAPSNLIIPPHRYVDENLLEIGVHQRPV
ncbi:ubiquinol-cytochrome c reductase iron-sulfur subunit [Kangiella sp. M94]